MDKISKSILWRVYHTLEEEIDQKILCLMEDHSNNRPKVEEELRKFLLTKMSEPMANALTSKIVEVIFPG